MDGEVRRELEGRFEGVVMTSACGSDGCGVGQRALGGRIEASPQRAAAHRPHRASVRHRGLQNVRPQPLYRSPPPFTAYWSRWGRPRGSRPSRAPGTADPATPSSEGSPSRSRSAADTRPSVADRLPGPRTPRGRGRTRAASSWFAAA